ncbi:hypothetical protein TPHA_0N00710 [Tetrapisispora phaffii CBS 4417]|uniref:Cytochrome c oxidase assembly protein COX16, mitochondrial n=1 Tax=Tetrapisispora phaffii (strain ATCC 24235 / CBS 4417 / NBRC 1672 / NRRL Y-8282 / UCD 70-5) TaxID=1071381 RepID=G8C124_TETPH|nr:hypothetical protein TPHA_0N00710 [Tetrapisispora phaffii CBS 4417]CCE65852.1 hypothetical protein TPHA_0N00710 [Tetrapisispora phaffii CBS 4417]
MLGDKVFRSKKQQKVFDASIAGRYQKLVKKNSFLYFGLPFCSLIVLGSYWLSDFTAIKYEQRDRKVQEVTESDLLKLKSNNHKFDIKEEYYRLQGIREQDWEPVRVQRLKDESENVW